MKREVFVRIATKALRQSQGQAPEMQAETIAQLMDLFSEVMGEDSPVSAAVPPSALPRSGPAFPAPNPAAFATYVPETTPDPPLPSEPSVIITDTRMPTPEQRVKPQPPDAPVRSIRPPAGKMKVEDLNLIIQENTPAFLKVEVELEDGEMRQVRLVRNVLSQHAADCVKLIYYPAGTSSRDQELTEIQAVFHIDDPLYIDSVLKKMKTQAQSSLRPRGPIVSITPPINPAPVTHMTNATNEHVAQLTQETLAVFTGTG
jgi:hypothetical protein